MIILAGLIGWQTAIKAAMPADSILPQVVFSIGKLQVTADEFKWKMSSCRTACFSWFTEHYGVYDGADFWQHGFSSDTPVVWLRQKALSELTEEKHRLLVMQSYGILPDYSFPCFLSLWEQENQERAAGVQSGTPIYGNIHFNKDSYYSYLFSKAWLETQRKYLEKQPATTAQLQAYYEASKEKQFKKTASQWVVLTVKGTGTGAESRQPIFFDPQMQKTDELQWGEIFTRSLSLKRTGEASDWFTNETGDSCRVVCTKRKQNGYLPFREVLENVKTNYAEQQLVRQVAVSRRKYKVEVDTAVLNTLYL